MRAVWHQRSVGIVRRVLVFLVSCIVLVVATCEGRKIEDVMVINLVNREILVEYSYTNGVFRDPQVLHIGIDSLDNKTRN